MHSVLNIDLANALVADRLREAERFRRSRVESAHLRNGSELGDVHRRGARGWLRGVLATGRS